MFNNIRVENTHTHTKVEIRIPRVLWYFEKWKKTVRCATLAGKPWAKLYGWENMKRGSVYMQPTENFPELWMLEKCCRNFWSSRTKKINFLVLKDLV